jgi:Fe2+ or Zn2+ uptake regulation protein
MEQTMIDKILDREIEEILREHPRKLIPLTEIVDKLSENRKRKGKDSVSKTTVFSKLEKMVKQKRLHHINRKGYKLLNYDFTEKDPNFRHFEVYKKIIDAVGFVYINKSGKLEQIWEELLDDVNEEDWNNLKNNYKKLIEQGILETKHYFKDSGYLLSVSYYWALYHDICPICLEKIELDKPHFALEFVEDEMAYILLTKTHIHCIEQILNRYELKEEYKGEPPKYDPFDEFNFEGISEKWTGLICPYCGLTTDLYDLFFNKKGLLENIYKEFQDNISGNQVYDYIQNLCRELFGDLSTLIWAKKIEFKKKVRLVIKKIVLMNGIAYHPNCAIRMKTEPYYSQKVNGEVMTNETTK